MHLIRNSIVVLVAIIFTASVATFAAEKVERVEKVENPEYKAWAKFKPGSSVTIDVAAANAGKPNHPTTRTLTLIEVVPEKVILEEKDWAGKTNVEIPAKIDSPQPPHGEIKESEEELEIAGAKIKCKLVTVTIRDNRGSNVSKTYTSDSVPGGFVQSQNGLIRSFVTAFVVK